jgi:hypothetical protein
MMELISLLLSVGIMFCVIAALLTAVAVGIGFLLAALISGLELGHGIIAGAVVVAAALYFLIKLMSAVRDYRDDDEDVLVDDSIVVLKKNLFQSRTWKPKHQSKKKGGG